MSKEQNSHENDFALIIVITNFMSSSSRSSASGAEFFIQQHHNKISWLMIKLFSELGYDWIF